MPQEPGYGSKRSQDGEAQRTCSERMPRWHPRTSGDGAWAPPDATLVQVVLPAKPHDPWLPQRVVLPAEAHDP